MCDDRRTASTSTNPLAQAVKSDSSFICGLQAWHLSPLASEESQLASSATSCSQGCSLVEPGFDTSDAATFPSSLTESDRDALRPIVWRRVTGHLVVPSSQYYSRLVKVCSDTEPVVRPWDQDKPG